MILILTVILIDPFDTGLIYPFMKAKVSFFPTDLI